MSNAWDCVTTFYACALIGACYVPLNARYRRDDLAFAIPKAELKVLLIGGHGLPHTELAAAMLDDVFPELAQRHDGLLRLANAPQLRAIYSISDPREAQLPTGAALDAAALRVPETAVFAAAATVRVDDACLMIFSSGTTARPKACLLTHASLERAGRALAERFRMTNTDRFWDPLPLFHMSTMLPLAACRASGAAFIGVAHFEPTAALAELERERATIAYPAFATLTTALIARPAFASTDLSRLRIVLNVGPVDLLRRYMAALPQAVHVNCYGLTEATGVPFFSELTDNRRTTAGNRRPAIRRRARAHCRTQKQVRCWALVRAAKSSSGDGACSLAITRMPSRTAEVFTSDGWLRTGDIGALQGQAYRLSRPLQRYAQDRWRERRRAGDRKLPDDPSSGAVGAGDCRAGRATCRSRRGVRRAETGCGSRQARARPTLRRQHRQGYKIPRYVRVVTSWPQSATKIQKFRLARRFQADGSHRCAGAGGGKPPTNG